LGRGIQWESWMPIWTINSIQLKLSMQKVGIKTIWQRQNCITINPCLRGFNIHCRQALAITWFISMQRLISEHWDKTRGGGIPRNGTSFQTSIILLPKTRTSSQSFDIPSYYSAGWITISNFLIFLFSLSIRSEWAMIISSFFSFFMLFFNDKVLAIFYTTRKFNLKNWMQKWQVRILYNRVRINSGRPRIYQFDLWMTRIFFFPFAFKFICMSEWVKLVWVNLTQLNLLNGLGGSSYCVIR
jgi:hypothetical protein